MRAAPRHTLRPRARIRQLVESVGADAQRLGFALTRAADAARRISDGRHQRALITTLVKHVKLLVEHVEIAIDSEATARHLGLPPPIRSSDSLIERIAIAPVRIGKQVKLVLGDGPNRRDETLVALLAESQAAREVVIKRPNETIREIAVSIGQCRSRFTKLVKLS